MKALLLAVALVLPAVAAAQATPAREDAGFRSGLYERYCDKLRESPAAYVQFVRRTMPIYGFTYWDFAPEYPGAVVKTDCKVAPERVAALHRMLAQSSR
jgi:hypothetical protein